MVRTRRRRYLKTRSYIPLLLGLCLCFQTGQAQSIESESSLLDGKLLRTIYYLDAPAVETVLSFASSSAYPAFLLIPTGVALDGFSRQNYEMSLNLGSAMVLTYGFTKVLKAQVSRLRPHERYDDIYTRIGSGLQAAESPRDAFPSGHAAMASTIAASISLHYNNIVAHGLSGGWVALVAVSRVWLGEHHPTDVIGGMIVGISSAVTIHQLAQHVTLMPRQNMHGSGIALYVRL